MPTPRGGMECLLEIVFGDKLDRRFLPTGQLLALKDSHADLDGIGCHFRAELIDGGKHLVLFDQFLHRTDVVETNDLDFTGLTRSRNGFFDPLRHGVFGTHIDLMVGVFCEQVGHQGVCFLGFPVSGF